MRTVEHPPGKYICIEGGDGTGKSTLCAELVRRLGEKAMPIRFPSDGIVGSVIRKALMGEIELDSKAFLYLFGADGLQEEGRIREALEFEGRHVICDRHPTLSGRAFQPEHHPKAHIEAVYDSATADGVSNPDFLFVLDVPVGEAIRRIGERKKYADVVFEKLDPAHIYKLKCRYLEIAEGFGGVVLDATETTEELANIIMEKAGLQ